VEEFRAEAQRLIDEMKNDPIRVSEIGQSYP